MLSFHTEAKRSPRSGLPIRSFEAEVEAGPEDLTVTRFNDEAGEWQALETELLETTDDYVRLEAETPGFSYFAVTAVDPPVAALSAPEEVEVGEEVTFDASDSTSEDAEIVAYDWTVDGESVDGTETMTHTFESAGEATVEVTVENDAGKTNTTSTELTVLEQEEPVTTTEEPAETTTEETPTATTTAEPTPEGEPGGFGFLQIGVVGVLLVALLVLFQLARRRL